jgi:hypothetical protein
LRAAGLPGTHVARELAVPRGTVRDWLAGKTPRSAGSGCCARCRGPDHQLERLPDAYVYLLGLYLGDGCISAHPRDVFRLRIVLDARYPSVIDRAEAAIRAVHPTNAVGRRLREYNDVEVSCYTKAWPCLFPQHGPGRKHERRIALEPWQREHVRRVPHLLARGLIHSDGCRFVNTGRDGWRAPRYAFTNLSDDIRATFSDACGQLGLRTTRSRATVYVSRKDDVALLDAHGCTKA